MDVFEQSGCIPAKMVEFGQKRLYSGKVVVFRQKLLHLGNCGFIRAKVIVFGQKLLYCNFVALFSSTGYNHQDFNIYIHR